MASDKSAQDNLIHVLEKIGHALLEWQEGRGRMGHWKGTQFKAAADQLAHERLTRDLTALFPGIPIVSEEDVRSQSIERPDCYWIIDPLDGTASYVGGYRGFVCQAALMDPSGPCLAAVVAPALELRYSAQRGIGAWLNGQRLRVTSEWRGILIDNYPEPCGIATELYRDMDFRNYIESGSIGLKICRVAEGVADVFFKDVVVRDWDLAAPSLVLTEAGGVISDVTGRPIHYHGLYEKHGLIAAHSDETLNQVANWYAGRDGKRTKCVPCSTIRSSHHEGYGDCRPSR